MNHNDKLFKHFNRLKNPIVVIPTKAEANVCIAPWDNSLEALQKLVDGYIEPCAPVELREHGIELLCNEMGVLNGLDPNEHLFPFFIVGWVVAVGVDEGDFTGLSLEQFEYLAEWLCHLKE